MTETRHIILSSDGRIATVGRYTTPTTEELDRAGAALASMGLGGWYATLTGNIYGRRKVTLSEVRPVAAGGSFAAAEAAFQSARKA